uniref:Doublecortin domain-containing protein n=1 Tax=Strongyloides stercoralis TaxID=6248 RepID=A0A0K0EEQ5_STRER
MSFSSLNCGDLEYGDDVYSKTVNLPVACFPEFSKQVRNLVQEYYNGECKLEGRLLFRGSGSVAGNNLSLSCLTSISQSSANNSSSYDSGTSDISDPYSYCNKRNNYKDSIVTASEGMSTTNKLERVKKNSQSKKLSTTGDSRTSTQKSFSTENTDKTTTNTSVEAPQRVFNKLRVYAHPDFMNSSTSNKVSNETTNNNSCSKDLSSKNTSTAPVFDDVKLVFCRNANINSYTSRKSLSPVSFDTNGSPKRFS